MAWPIFGHVSIIEHYNTRQVRLLFRWEQFYVRHVTKEQHNDWLRDIEQSVTERVKHIAKVKVNAVAQLFGIIDDKRWANQVGKEKKSKLLQYGKCCTSLWRLFSRPISFIII